MFPENYTEGIEDYESELLERYTVSENRLVEEMNEVAKEQFRSGSSHTRPKILYAFAEGLGTDYNEETLVKLAGLVQFHHEGSLKLDDKHDDDKLRRNGEAYPEKMMEATGSKRVGNVVTDSQVIKQTIIPYMEIDQLNISFKDREKYRNVLGDAIIRLSEGQAQDNAAEESREALGIEDYDDETKWYIQMVNLKTGALLDASAEIGAVAAGKDVEDVLGWSRIVGTMYQVQDDVLDNLADETKRNIEKTPKDRFSDLEEDKESIFWQLAEEYDETGIVEHVRSNEEKSEEMLEKAWEEAQNSGAVEEIDEMMEDMEDEAIEALDGMEWENQEYKMYLEELTSKLKAPVKAAKPN